MPTETRTATQNLAKTWPPPAHARLKKGKANGATRCRRKFLRFFPEGFYDDTFLDWERNYKSEASERWAEQLNPSEFARLLQAGDHREIADRAVRIESRTNLLFSFEKMALRDAVKSPTGARQFAVGLYAFLHGPGELEARFDGWCEIVAGLPRKQTRVLTWPVATVFGFIAQPKTHIFFKPTVTRAAAREYGYELEYQSRPAGLAYAKLLRFAAAVRSDLRDMRPRDMIDLQSFLWVQGSGEYQE